MNEEFAKFLTAGFQVVAAMRRFAAANADLALRFEAADGGEPVTAEEVDQMFAALQAEIDRGRDL